MAPIGVFDSGLGGLTVVAEMKKLMPEEAVLYVGDTARVPYGTRSHDTIVEFSLECARFLERQGVKLIVVACNTASAHAYEAIKQEVSVPVFEVISWGARGAIDVTGNKKIGVIGTRATIGSHAYKRHLEGIDGEVDVREVACPLFVPLVEEGEVSGEIAEAIVKKYLQEFSDFPMDALLLGCTHYPVLAEVISRVVPKGVVQVNPGAYMAAGLVEFLVEKGLAENGGEDRYYFTDMTSRYMKVAEMFLGSPLGCVERIEKL